jgi:phage gp29-like protein
MPLSLRARGALAAVRQLGRAVLGRPEQGTLTRPAIGDFPALMWGGRRLTPDQVRGILGGALGGHLQQQWELFDLMEDTWPRLAKNLNELKRAAARVTLNVQPYARRGEASSESARERADLVDAALRNWQPRPGTLELGMEEALYHALDAYGKGVSVLEITWQRHPEGLLPRCAHLLHPRHYGWDETGAELGLVQAGERGTAVWQPFPPGQFWVGLWHARSGAPGQTALLRCLAPYWCGITFGWEWLLNNAQLFGVPLRWATYDPGRTDLLPTLTDMLANLGQAGWAAFPAGTTMEFKEAVQRAADNPQVLVQTMADRACDLLILGQEASSESKPAGIGSGAADLHGAVRADRLQDAAQWCADLLNYQLVPAILRWNYGDELELPTIIPDLIGEPDPKSKAERDVQLAQLVPMPRKWFYARHAIPEPEVGEETIGGPAAADPASPLAGGVIPGVLAPGGGTPLATGHEMTPRGNLPKNGDLAPGGIQAATPPAKRASVNPPRSAVALRAAAGAHHGHHLPGAYQPPTATHQALAEAHSRDFASLRKAAAPILASIEAGHLDLVGEIEAFIARLDQAAPTMPGAGELADVLEDALAEAAIAGAAQSYRKLSP